MQEKSLSERQKEILAEIIRFKKKWFFTDSQGTVQISCTQINIKYGSTVK